MCFPKKHHGHRAWWHHLFKQTSVIPAWEQLKPSAAALHHNTKKWPPVPAVTWVKLHISECCISNPLALAANCVGMNIAGSLGVGIVLPGSSSLSTTELWGLAQFGFTAPQCSALWLRRVSLGQARLWGLGGALRCPPSTALSSELLWHRGQGLWALGWQGEPRHCFIHCRHVGTQWARHPPNSVNTFTDSQLGNQISLSFSWKIPCHMGIQGFPALLFPGFEYTLLEH